MGERTRRLSKKTLGIVASLALAIGLLFLPMAVFTAKPALADDAMTYEVTINGGTADKPTYTAGETVTIEAELEAGKAFVQWKSTDGVTFTEPDSVKTTFTMPAKDVTVTAVFAPIVIEGIDLGYTYTGKPIEPRPTKIYLDGVDLIVSGNSCEYANNEDVGTATLTVTLSDHRGSKTVTFDITAASIKDASTTTDVKVEVPDQVYGDKPNPTIAWEDITLEEGKDYELSYDANAPVGTSTVTITGTGNFKDSISADYTITERPVTITVDDSSKVVGEADPAFTGTVAGLVKDGDLGKIKYVRTNDDEAVGTYKDVLTATYMPNTNYAVSVVNGSFTIKELYTVIWLDGDGSMLQTKTYVDGDEPPAYDGKTPTKAATAQCTYVFTGWDDGTVEGTTTTYKPLFDEVPITATLTFDLAGGTLDGQTGSFTITANVGDTVEIPKAPTRTGYTFKYWKGSEHKPGDKYTVEGDHTFTAVWEKKAGGSGSSTSSGTRHALPATGDNNAMLSVALLFAVLGLSCVLAACASRRKVYRGQHSR